MGSLGLIAFAIVGAVLLPRVAPALALAAASLAWALVAMTAYGVARAASRGADEATGRT